MRSGFEARLITLLGFYSDFALFVCEYVYIEISLRDLILSEFSIYVGGLHLC